MIKSTILTMAAVALISTAAFAQSSSDGQADATAADAATTTEPAAADGLGLASSESVDLAKFTCWDAVTLAEDDRRSLMVLLYGYVIGTRQQTIISAQNIQVALVNTLMDCVDAPDKNALELLQEKMARSTAATEE